MISEAQRQYRINKENEVVVKMESDALNYDEHTVGNLLLELERGIERAKINQFKERLSQERVIPAINIPEVEGNLNNIEKRELTYLIDKIGTINSLKLMNILKGPINRDKQQRMYEIFKERLSEKEIIRLNDILGKYIER